MNPWTYKGYIGLAAVDTEQDVIRGRVINIRDTVTFEGDTVQEAKRAFQESVDDYLEFCASLGETPDKPFSGKLLVRIQPSLHRDLMVAAQLEGVSVNKLVGLALKKATARARSTLNAEGAMPRAAAPKPSVTAAAKPAKNSQNPGKAKTRKPATKV